MLAKRYKSIGLFHFGRFFVGGLLNTPLCMRAFACFAITQAYARYIPLFNALCIYSLI